MCTEEQIETGILMCFGNLCFLRQEERAQDPEANGGVCSPVQALVP